MLTLEGVHVKEMTAFMTPQLFPASACRRRFRLMWDERIARVRAFADAITERDIETALRLCHPEVEFFSMLGQLEARPYRGFGGIRSYFQDVDATWDEWRVEVEQLWSAPDGRVVILMSTHMRGKGSGLPFAQRVAHLWEFEDEKLWRATLFRDPADALRAAGVER